MQEGTYGIQRNETQCYECILSKLTCLGSVHLAPAPGYWLIEPFFETCVSGHTGDDMLAPRSRMFYSNLSKVVDMTSSVRFGGSTRRSSKGSKGGGSIGSGHKGNKERNTPRAAQSTSYTSQIAEFNCSGGILLNSPDYVLALASPANFHDGLEGPAGVVRCPGGESACPNPKGMMSCKHLFGSFADCTHTWTHVHTWTLHTCLHACLYTQVLQDIGAQLVLAASRALLGARGMCAHCAIRCPHLCSISWLLPFSLSPLGCITSLPQVKPSLRSHNCLQCTAYSLHCRICQFVNSSYFGLRYYHESPR